jgi:hypothetical protein
MARAAFALDSPGIADHRSSTTLILAACVAFAFITFVLMTRLLHGATMRANLAFTALGVFVTLAPPVLLVWVSPSSPMAAVNRVQVARATILVAVEAA